MNQKTLKELQSDFAAIEAAVEAIAQDFPKLEKGQAKAGRRMRKNLLVLSKKSRTSRALILANQKGHNPKEK